MFPALMPTRSASGVPGPLAFTEGVFADSVAGDGVALVNGIGLVTEHPASSAAPRRAATPTMMRLRRLLTFRTPSHGLTGLVVTQRGHL